MVSLSREKLPVASVISLLDDFDTMFSPSLSSHINLSAFAEKLALNAFFVLCRQGEELIGYIAFYENKDTGICYIPSVCVKDTYRSNGIASLMMDYLISRLNSDIKTISLEVRKNNDSAVGFYQKQGFAITEDRGDKLLMSKYLNR